MSAENSDVSSPLNLEKCSLVLVDVAGTTTSINFVTETLFPFALKEVDGFLRAKWDEEAVKACVEQMKDGTVLDVAAAVERVKRLTEEKSTNKGLKDLQGLIYKQGYEKGDLKAHVFEDVPEALEAWAKTRRVAVYSTGSVDSQKLLFGHTASGDLTAHITKYFDQEVGPKTEADSYKKIAQELEVAPEEIVFVTDDAAEAAAAKTSGVTVVLIKREGNAPLAEDISKEFTVISSFKDLGLDKTSKRKVEEETVAAEERPAKVAKTDAVEDESKTSDEKVDQTVDHMEVDSTTEKTTEESKTATEETEKTDITTEKTEAETKDVETNDTSETPKEAADKMETATEPESADVPKEKEDQKSEENAVEMTETPNEEKKDTDDKDKKVADEVKPAETSEEKDKTVSEKTENEEKPIEDTKPQVATEAVNEESKTSVELTEENKKSVEQTNGEDTTEEKTESPVEEATAATEEKVTDGTADAESSTTKIEEKENESLLANGVENGKEQSDVEAAGEGATVKTDDTDKDDEVKVKKLEESAESKTVTVEV